MSVTLNFFANYETVYPQLEEIYLRYFDPEKTPLLPTHDQYIKTNTALINVNLPPVDESKLNQQKASYLDINPIIPDLIDDYRQALYYVGLCHRIVPSNRKHLDTRIFNGEIVYQPREFGYIPKPLKWSYSKLIELSFSASAFRTMCVKAEIAIFLYYAALSNMLRKQQNATPKEDSVFVDHKYVDEDGIEHTTKLLKSVDALTEEEYDKYVKHNAEEQKITDPITTEMKVILGAFGYAINRMNSVEQTYSKMAIYVWELATFINVFAGLDENFEADYCLPYHHVFQSTCRFSHIAEFGDYDMIRLYVLKQFNHIDSTYFQNSRPKNTYAEDDVMKLSDEMKNFISHLTKNPKLQTTINFTEDVWFYNPVYSTTVEVCSKCFDDHVDNAMCILRESNDLRRTANELCKIESYEQFFLMEKDDKYDSKGEFFKDTQEAIDYMNGIEIPTDFDKSKLYLMAMLNINQDGDKPCYRLQLLNFGEHSISACGEHVQ